MTPAPRSGKAKKIVLISAIAVVLLVFVAVLLIPTIASSLAPGIIEKQAAAAIKGQVKVSSVSVGWSGPTKINGIKLLDDQGQTVAELEAESSLGILSALGGLADLGSFKLSGKLDLVSKVDAKGQATSNLERAVASRSAAPTPATTKPSSLPALAAKLELLGLDIRFRQLDAAGATLSESSIKSAKGNAAFSTITPGGTADITLTAALAQSSAATTTPLTLTANVTNFVSTTGQLDITGTRGNAIASAAGVPTALIETLAAGAIPTGVLTDAIGPASSLELAWKGEVTSSAAKFAVTGDNAKLTGNVRLSPARVSLEEGIVAEFKSTRFIERLPALQAALANAGIKIEDYPAATFQLATLDANVPKSGAALDLRTTFLHLNVYIAPITATLATPAGVQGPAVRRVQTDSFKLSISSPGLDKEMNIEGGTSAAIDGSPAGVFRINAKLASLLTPSGELRPMPGSVQADIAATQINNALLQPILTGMKIPVDLLTDVGSHTDFRVSANTTGVEGAIDGDVTLTAQHLNVKIPVTISPTQISTRSDAQLNFADVTRIARRIYEQNAAGVPFMIGDSPTPLNITASFVLPRTPQGIDTANTRGQLSMTLRDLMLGYLPSAKEPEVFTLQPTTLTAAITPGQPAKLDLNAGIRSVSGVSTIKGAFTITGLLGDSQNPALLGLGARRVSGRLTATDLPISLARLGLTAQQSLDTAELRYALGGKLTIDTTLTSAPASQSFAFILRSAAITADAHGELEPAALKLAGATATLNADSALLKAALATAKVEGDLRQLEMERPAKITLAVKPVTIPIASGSLNLAGADLLALSLTSDAPLLVRNLPLGPGRTFNGGLDALKLDLSAPGSALAGGGTGGAPGAQRATGTFSAKLIESGVATPVALAAATFTAAADASELHAQIKLTGIQTLRADAMLNEPGLVSGALGDSADIVINADKPAGDWAAHPLKLAIDLKAPRLTTSPIEFTQGKGSIALAKPVDIKWTIDPAFLERTAFKPAPPAPGAAPITSRLIASDPVQLNLKITELAIGSGDGHTTFEPGIFKVNIELDSPRVALATQQLKSQRWETADTSALEAITASIKGDGSRLAIAAKIARVGVGQRITDAPMTLDVALTQFAGPGQSFSTATADIYLSAPRIPTALADQLAKSGKQLRDLLGPGMSVAVKARGFRTGSGPVATTASPSAPGTIEAKFLSVKPAEEAPKPGEKRKTQQQASVDLRGPVNASVLSITQKNPLNVTLATFAFGSDAEILGVLPLFASIEKTGKPLPPLKPGDPPIADSPLTISSQNLTIPVDGDLRRLNGQLDVSVGRIDYVFKREFGQFLDQALFTEGGTQQPIPPFPVTFTGGTASYQNVQLPIRNFIFKLEGKVDLVNRTVDSVIYIPTLAASAGIMSKVNGDLGKGFGKILPDVLSEGTMLPIRVTGPLDKPSYSVDVELFFKNIGNQLKPDKILDGIGKGIGDLLDRKNKK